IKILTLWYSNDVILKKRERCTNDFVLDIGNTNTMLGVFSDDKIEYSWRIRTDRHKTEDELGMLVKSLFDFNGLHLKDINGIIVSSVVPPILRAVEVMCRMYFNIEPLIVGGEN